MKCKPIPREMLDTCASRFVWAYCVTQSDPAYLGTVRIPNWEELVEARFFSEEGELRVFLDEKNDLRAVLLSDEPEDVTTEEAYITEPHFGKKLTVRKYLAFDRDGQAFVRCTRLLRWEGA